MFYILLINIIQVLLLSVLPFKVDFDLRYSSVYFRDLDFFYFLNVELST